MKKIYINEGQCKLLMINNVGVEERKKKKGDC